LGANEVFNAKSAITTWTPSLPGEIGGGDPNKTVNLIRAFLDLKNPPAGQCQLCEIIPLAVSDELRSQNPDGAGRIAFRSPDEGETDVRLTSWPGHLVQHKSFWLNFVFQNFRSVRSFARMASASCSPHSIASDRTGAGVTRT